MQKAIMEKYSELSHAHHNVDSVLRDTFRLLGIMLGITVVTGFLSNAIGLFDVLGMVGFYAAVIAQFVLIFVIHKAANNPDAGSIGWMMVFAALEGVILEPIVTAVAAENASAVIAALATTALVFLVMTYIAQKIERDLSDLGAFLLVGLIALIGASIINIFVGSSLMSTVISAIASIVFSLYILHDVNQIVRGGETNYVRATLSLFIDITGLFIHLLSLMSSSDD